MKKLFSYFGLVIMCLMTFVYNNKTVQVVKKYDSLMTEIEEKKEKFKIEPTEAIITKDTIIPGKNGKELDLDKTYYQMKKIGYYDENYIILKNINVKEKLTNNKNKKIISGSSLFKQVTIIILGKNIDNDKVSYLNNTYCIYMQKNNCKDKYIIDEKIIDNNYVFNVKKELKNGKIFLFSDNGVLEKELKIIINYIENKGYEIVTIDNLLKE